MPRSPAPTWIIRRRRYTGVEDSFITPGCRKVTTKHGFVILIVDEKQRLFAEIANGGAIFRGWRERGFVEPTTPRTGGRVAHIDWKKQGKSFVRACADYERNR